MRIMRYGGSMTQTLYFEVLRVMTLMRNGIEYQRVGTILHGWG